VTKPWTALPLDYWENGWASRPLPLSAAATCFSRLRQLRSRFQWVDQIIEAWLDGRIEVDYLSARALKLVVVLETLRAGVYGEKSPESQLIVPDAIWTDALKFILRQLRFYLTAGLKVNAEKRDQICMVEKWQELNRRSFRATLKATLKELSVSESEATLDFVVRMRNRLVHEGNFLCETIGVGYSHPLGESPDKTKEFLFLVAFLDRVVLQMLGLGTYVRKDSSEPDAAGPDE
jgi:hypothetical protein